MPQQPGHKIPRAWTQDAILALVEQKARSLIKRIGDLGGDPVDHGVLSGLADDDHVQYLIDLPGTGGDGITVTSRTISVDLTDNTIMAKVGAAAAGPLALSTNEIVIRGTGDIVALSFANNSILGRFGADPLTEHIFVTNSFLMKQGSADLGIALIGPNQIIGRKSGDMGTFNIDPNTVVLRAGGDWDAFPMPANTVLVRAGGDIVALSMPHVFDVSGSLLVRDGNNPTTDIKALVTPKNTVPVVNTAGNWVARNFTPNANIVADSLGGLTSSVLGADRWVITNSLGALSELVAVTDWMLVGVANAPSFIISAANAFVGKFGSAATAFNVIAAESLALRGSGSLASTTIPDSNFVGRPVSGSLGAVTPAQARTMLGKTGIIKTANETRFNTTFTVDADLTRPLAANTKYKLTLVVGVTSHPTPDFKYRMLLPAGAAGLGSAFWAQAGGSNVFTNLLEKFTAHGLFIINSAVDHFLVITATIEVAGTSGNLDFEWAQRVVDAVNGTTVQADSWMHLEVFD